MKGFRLFFWLLVAALIVAVLYLEQHDWKLPERPPCHDTGQASCE